MRNRTGFSLVEMVIVMVLAGIVSTAAISMFSTQNRLNAAMTALGESQENARSAVQVAASELHAASGGAIVLATAHRLVVRVPVVLGIICGDFNPQTKAVYFPMNGRILDLREDVDGYGFRSAWGYWNTDYRFHAADGFHGASARVACQDAGNGQAGADADYARLRVGGDIGTAVMLHREITYSFGPSALDPTRRAFFRTRGDDVVELAQGFSSATRFEYFLDDRLGWHTSVTTADRGHIDAVRLFAEVVAEGASGSATGSATFALTRDIQMKNAR